jgi:hypothetical protein
MNLTEDENKDNLPPTEIDPELNLDEDPMLNVVDLFQVGDIEAVKNLIHQQVVRTVSVDINNANIKDETDDLPQD